MGPLTAWLEQSRARLILVGGKGGVGKTSMASALALILARRSEGPVLIASTDPAHSLGDVLDHPVGPETVPVGSVPNLFAREISAERLLSRFLDEHGEALLRLVSRGTWLGDRDLVPFFRLSLPGLDEVMAILELATELDGQGFAHIVLDTAPTGHTLRLLEMPDAMIRWTDYLDTIQGKHRYLRERYAGTSDPDAEDRFLADLASKLKALRALLRDRDRTTFLPVTLAEPMSLAECRRLMRQLDQMEIPRGPLLVNQLRPASGCSFCRLRARSQAVLLEGLTAGGRDETIQAIPLMRRELRGTRALESMGHALGGTPDGPPVAPDAADPADPGFCDAPCPGEAPPAGTAKPDPLPATIRLLLFGGKGGVGKTTMASLFAREFVTRRPGCRVLLVSTDPAHSLGDFFDCPVGDEAREHPDHPGLFLQAIDPTRTWEGLRRTYDRDIRAVLRTLVRSEEVEVAFDAEALTGILDFAPPGLDELMALSRLSEHLAGGRFDLLVLDTAPTGHTLRLLGLPDLGLEWIRAFFDLLLRHRSLLRLPHVSDSLVDLSRQLHQILEVLRDRALARFVGVTIPTRVALEETRRLFHGLGEVGVACHAWIVNQVPQTRDCGFCRVRSGESRAVIEAMRAGGDLPALLLVPEAPEPIGARDRSSWHDGVNSLMAGMVPGPDRAEAALHRVNS